jgi:hypothetical protein
MSCPKYTHAKQNFSEIMAFPLFSADFTLSVQCARCPVAVINTVHLATVAFAPPSLSICSVAFGTVPALSLPLKQNRRAEVWTIGDGNGRAFCIGSKRPYARTVAVRMCLLATRQDVLGYGYWRVMGPKKVCDLHSVSVVAPPLPPAGETVCLAANKQT